MLLLLSLAVVDSLHAATQQRSASGRRAGPPRAQAGPRRKTLRQLLRLGLLKGAKAVRGKLNELLLLLLLLVLSHNRGQYIFWQRRELLKVVVVVIIAGAAVGGYQWSVVAKTTAGRLSSTVVAITTTTEHGSRRTDPVVIILAKVRQVVHVIIGVRITVVVLEQQELLGMLLLAFPHRRGQLVGPLRVNLPVDMTVGTHRPEDHLPSGRDKVSLRIRLTPRRVRRGANRHRVWGEADMRATGVVVVARTRMAAEALFLFERVGELQQLLLLRTGQMIHLLLLRLGRHHPVDVVHQLGAVGVEGDVGRVGEGGTQAQRGRRLRRPQVQVILAVREGRRGHEVAAVRLVNEILGHLQHKYRQVSKEGMKL